MYFLELDNKEKINSRISVPLSIVTLLAGGFVFLLSNLNDIKGEVWKPLFFSFFSLFTVAFLISIFYMGKAYYNYRYQYLPSLADLDDQAQQLELYVDNLIAKGEVQAENKEEILELEIQRSLCEQYKQITDVNTNLNLKKLEYLRKVGIWVLASLVFGTACMIPVLFGKSDEVQKVKIIKSIDKAGGKND
ncbi:hypothetical protein [Bacillus sp. EB600]|uniref:hypothetical protein n=1 Tax=Bacillus sp. EB600 TaxID=2806345 RepID=UPI00210C894A|nr:hypothetical protein [Bacillus sp. EB600]MCQ6280053.1 hypothetical protein [Bacillus sp. EB600]